jgi:type I restriction-modification system DNA methylase subunit/restriction endonuclease S subunit
MSFNTKDSSTIDKQTLINLFKNCLNILRDNDGLTGEKALRNLSYLLILKLIEPHIGGEINIDDYEYDFSSHFSDDTIEHNKKRIFEIVRFSKLSYENGENVPNLMKYLWDVVLSVNPSTKNIFLKNKGFDIKHTKTYVKLIDKLNSIDLFKTEHDVLGDAYEEVIQDVMIGKVLGQFFTQPLVKRMMVKLINPQVYSDGTIDSCGDLAMGTGGFLITYLNHISRQAEARKIKLNWEFIKNKGIYGRELEPDTYQLAVSNILISTGHMFDKLECGDSIRNPIKRKFDYVLANPPFGIKGLDYDEIKFNDAHIKKEDYIPIKANNAVSLFIQAIIYILNINGKCAVVVPDGQDLFNKTNATLIAVREYLMKTCDLHEIIYLPSGIFTYTSIKTCVFYFTKKKEGSDVLEVEVKYSNKTKIQKEVSRKHIFDSALQTKSIKFYEWNPADDTKKLLIDVPIEKITSNSYSLNYAEYMKDETEEEYEDGVVVKTLGEVCSIDYGTRIVKGNNTEGEYSVYGSGRAMFSTNTFNREGYNILIGRFALSLECVRFITEKIFLNDSGLSIKPKTDLLLHKYIGYYLLHNQSIIYNCARGTAQKNLEMNIFKSIKIPIPPLERQKEIVKYLDFIYEKANKTSNEKIAELKQLNEFCLNNQIKYGENIIKKLGEVCNFKNGKGIKKDTLVDGEYPVIGGGQKPMGFHNEYNTNENTILCSSSGAYAGFISKYDKKVWASDCFSIIPKDKSIENNYLYYFLKITQDKIYKLQTGTAQPHIYSKNLQNLKIPLPSLERQKEIVEYYEKNDKLIKALEEEIEENKRQAQMFMLNIVKNKKMEEEEKDEDDEKDIHKSVKAKKMSEKTKEKLRMIMEEEDEDEIEYKKKLKMKELMKEN